MMESRSTKAKNRSKTTLGIFVKHPIAGRVKTRLAADVGKERASQIYSAFIADLTNRFQKCADRRILCYSPYEPAAEKYFRELAGENYDLWPQPDSSLGERMESFFSEQLTSKGDRVVLIGSDSPTLPIQFVEQAFDQLTESECVIGPATDGGYYLIGQRGKANAIFHDIDWSSSRVLSQSASRISELGISLSLLSPWYDIDTADDLSLLKGHINLLQMSGTSMNLDHTSKILGGESV